MTVAPAAAAKLIVPLGAVVICLSIVMVAPDTVVTLEPVGMSVPVTDMPTKMLPLMPVTVTVDSVKAVDEVIAADFFVPVTLLPSATSWVENTRVWFVNVMFVEPYLATVALKPMAKVPFELTDLLVTVTFAPSEAAK